MIVTHVQHVMRYTLFQQTNRPMDPRPLCGAGGAPSGWLLCEPSHASYRSEVWHQTVFSFRLCSSVEHNLDLAFVCERKHTVETKRLIHTT